MELQKYEQEYLDILRPLLPECTVLLKKNGDFPLEKPGKIALYGNGVRKTIKGGTGQNHAEIDTIPYPQKCRKSAVSGRFFNFRHCGGVGRMAALPRWFTLFGGTL